MQVDRVDMSNPLAQKIYKLKFDNWLSILTGEYREAIKAQKELAKIGVDNFELMTKVESPVRGTVTLFSKYGFRLIVATIIDKFRIKTPEEKKFREMCELFKKGCLKV